MNEEYDVIGTLGKGGFATVIAVRDKSGKEYALKKPFHKKIYLDGSTGAINMKELYIMTYIKHPFIQGALRVYFTDPCPNDNIYLEPNEVYDRMFFLMEKAQYTCHELCKQFNAPVSHIKRAMFQTTCALHHLHTYGICHRDIKPGNILCFYDNGVLTAKLTDFGMTKPINFVGRHSLHAGTAYYRAPELILQNKEYDFSMDIWSLGCTFFEMISKVALFKGKTDIEILNIIFNKRGSPSPEVFKRISAPGVNFVVGNHRRKKISNLIKITPNNLKLFEMEVVDNLHNPGTFIDFCDDIDRMIDIDPKKRPSATELLQGKFFSTFFTPHPLDYGLWRPSKKELLMKTRESEDMNIVQVYPEAHSKMWHYGANVFIDMDPLDKNKYDYEVSYSIRFHGLDIYCRTLNKIEVMDNPDQYRFLGWCAGYIASKFFLDEASEHLWDLFPNSYNEISVDQITKYERIILQLLEFEIYRPTCFTYLEHRAFYATLFILTVTKRLMYNRPLKRIMEIVNSEIFSTIKLNPPGSIPIE